MIGPDIQDGSKSPGKSPCKSPDQRLIDKLNLKPGTFSPLKLRMQSTDGFGSPELLSPSSPSKKKKNNRFLPSNS
jgi:hypothetical protein